MNAQFIAWFIDRIVLLIKISFAIVALGILALAALAAYALDACVGIPMWVTAVVLVAIVGGYALHAYIDDRREEKRRQTT